MREPRPYRLVDWMLLLAVLAVAAGARGWYLCEYADRGYGPGAVAVQDVDEVALQTQLDGWRTGQGFVGRPPLAGQPEPTAHAAPGYSWLLSLLDRLTDDWRVAARWLQAAAGAATAALYFAFARRSFGSGVAAALAGLLCAVSPFWVAATAELADGVASSLLLAAALFLGVRAGQTGGPFTSLLFGLVLAGLALVRAALLPFAFVALLWFLWRCRPLPRGWACAALALLGFANGLAPWAVRNLRTFGDLLPVVDSTYLHLWIGNNPRATGGPLDDKALRAALEGQAGGGKSSAEELADLPQDERYRRLAPLALAEVRDNPSGTLRRRLWVALCFAFGEDWLRQGTSATPRWQGVLSGTLLAMFLLAGFGWRWSFGRRPEVTLASLAVVWVPLPYLLGHAEALYGPRLPLDGVLLGYAAFALAALVPGAGRALLRLEDDRSDPDEPPSD